MEGFQLWLNLPSGEKMRAPWYRDIASEQIPEFTTNEGVRVRVVAGESHGVAGAVQREGTEPLYLDLHFPSGEAVFRQPIPAGHNAFLCVYRGRVAVLDAKGQPTPVPPQSMALLGNEGDGVVLQSDADSTEPARALLIAGKPLREPIAQYGPFVMNTREQLMEAVQDFQNGRFG